MSEIQVHRRLVKSHPELWAELSDAEALARRLEPFGEIRITRLEPETTIAWEGEQVSGTVEIAESGWGTRVTLTAEPEPSALSPQPPVAEPEHSALSPQPSVAEPEPLPVAEISPEPELVEVPVAWEELEQATEPPEAESEDAVEAPLTWEELERAAGPPELPAAAAATPPAEPEPRRGFFARMFGRRDPVMPEAAVPSASVVAEPIPAAASVVDEGPAAPAPSVAEPVPTVVEPPVAAEEPPVEDEQPPAEEEGPPAAEENPPFVDENPPAPTADAEPEEPPSAAEPALASSEEVLAVLTAVLDDLGAAHHRPFSRG